MAAVVGALAKSALNPKTLALFNQSMQAMNSVASQAKDLIGWQEAVNTFMQTFAPLAAPLQIIAGQMSSGVMENVIKLTQTLMEQMSSEPVQYFVNRQIDWLNFLLENANILVGYIDDVVPFVQSIGAFFADKLGPMVAPTQALLTQLGGFLDTTFKTFIDWFMNTVMPWFDSNLRPGIEGFIHLLEHLSQDVWEGLLKPAFDEIVKYLTWVADGFKTLTGIDVAAWINSIVNTVSGWFS